MSKSYRDQFEEAMLCNTPEEAEEWIKKEVQQYVEEFKKAPQEALDIIRNNLGYMADYYGHETAQKIHHLFNAVHPIFGSSAYHQDVTPEEAFKVGQDLGKRYRTA